MWKNKEGLSSNSFVPLGTLFAETDGDWLLTCFRQKPEEYLRRVSLSCSWRWCFSSVGQWICGSSGSRASGWWKRTGSQPVIMSKVMTQPSEWDTMDTFPFFSKSGFREQKSEYRRFSSRVNPLVIYTNKTTACVHNTMRYKFNYVNQSQIDMIIFDVLGSFWSAGRPVLHSQSGLQNLNQILSVTKFGLA